MNRMFGFAAALCVLCATVAAFGEEPAKPEKEKAKQREQQAVDAATKWLDLVDAGKYGDSYKEAAEFFKGAITKEQWEKTAPGARKPLGALVSRKLKSATFATELPGAPDGEYVVIQFDSSFKNKKTAVETITPMKQKDGSWRVSGYFIK
jgi:hypothetical protein